METTQVVTPGNLDTTLKMGKNEEGKYGVNHDNTLTTNEQGQLSVAMGGAYRVTNLDTLAEVPSAPGFYCIYGAHTPENPVIGMPIGAETRNVGNELPRYKAGGTTERYDWSGFVTRNSKQTDVTLYSSAHVWFSTNDSNDGFDSTQWSVWKRLDNAKAGLDCEAIAELPPATWQAGTTVLGQQNGSCVRLVPRETLFQEIGVGMAASKTVGDVGDTYHVITTVTNSGEGTNEVTELVITKPALGSYTLSNFTNHASTGATIEKVDDLHYNIRGLKSGGTAKVEFDVVANASGTFQFGASVNANTALDMQSNNNTATVTLSARIAVNPDIVPSADCPIIDVTVDGHKLVSHSKDITVIATAGYNTGITNLLLNHNSLAGLAITIAQDVTIIVQSSEAIYNRQMIKLTNGMFVKSSTRGYMETFVDPTDSVSSDFKDYTYENSLLTFGPTTSETVRVSVRPKGNACKWQHFDILAGSWAYTPAYTVTINTTLPHTKTLAYNVNEVTDSDATLDKYRRETNIVGDAQIEGIYYDQNSVKVTQQDALVITLPAGQVSSGTITATGDYLANLNTQGNIKCVYDPATKQVTVTTLDTVSAADNFVYKNITFKVE